MTKEKYMGIKHDLYYVPNKEIAEGVDLAFSFVIENWFGNSAKTRFLAHQSALELV